MFDFHFDTDKLISQLTYNSKDPLLFNSGFFLFFFCAFLLGYQFLYKRKLLRVVYFTVFSLYFFYKACGFYFGFILLSAVVDFNLSNWIYTAKTKGRKNAILIFSIIINLGLLFYFKYTDFFIEIINDLEIGQVKPLKLILPIGISFYTFENLSYTIDVYRGKFKPVSSFLDYCFFLSFFPKLVMGPIVRASDFIPQIRKDIYITKEDIAKGLYLILGGLFKKVVISDYIYVNYVQYIFDDPSRHSGIECLLGVYGYAMVIYCDFSGYSDMAIGMARWMGFSINENFDSPYQSSSITESALTVDQVTMQPRTIGALTDYSRRLLLQSSIDIENLVRRDLAQSIAIEVENQAINGTGTGSYPLGILNVTGINTESGVAAFSDFVNAEASLSTDNALLGSLGYLMNSALRGTLKTTEKATTTNGVFVYEADNTINGYSAYVSNSMPNSTAIFANFSDILMGFWSGLDIMVDPYTGSASGTVRVVAMQDYDIAIRHPESICKLS